MCNYPALVRLAQLILTAPVPIAVAGVTVLLCALANKIDYQPFFLTLALFALSYAGLGISMYPYRAAEHHIWQAASARQHQLFMLSASPCWIR